MSKASLLLCCSLSRLLFAQGLFINPTELTTCQTCCEEAFVDQGQDIIDLCSDNGCNSFGNCFAFENVSVCQTGRDFRLIGASKLDDVDFYCDDAGVSEADLDFTSAANVAIEETTCSECCTSFGDVFNTDDDVFDEGFCQNGCENAGRDCLNEGSNSNRFGCSIGLDFRLSGVSQSTFDENEDFVESFELECVDGEVSVVDNVVEATLAPTTENVIPDLLDVNNLGVLEIGVIAGAGALCLLCIVFVARRRTPSRVSESHSGPVNLKFGQQVAVSTTLSGTSRVGTPPGQLRSPEPIVKQKNSTFNFLRSMNVFSSPERDSNFNIRIGKASLDLKPVGSSYDAQPGRLSGLAPPTRKIWSIRNTTQSLFSTTTKRSTVTDYFNPKRKNKGAMVPQELSHLNNLESKEPTSQFRQLQASENFSILEPSMGAERIESSNMHRSKKKRRRRKKDDDEDENIDY